jgi:hypothetical protein
MVRTCHTLQKFFTGILLKKGLMNDRSSQVIDHELEDGLNFLFSVSSIVGQCRILSSVRHIQIRQSDKTYPFTSLENQACQVHRSSRDMTRQILHETVVKKTDLHEILAEGAGMDIVVVGL